MTADPPIATTAFECRTLPIADSFTISRATSESVDNILVRIEDTAATTGIGGAAPSAYYGETADGAAAVLPDLLDAVETVGDPHNQQEIERRLAAIAPDQAAARAAVSIAVHDLAARQRGEPLYRRWGFDPEQAPKTSYTVGIDTPEAMAESARRIREAGYPILKVKLGTDDDRERLEAVRAATPDARIRVDINGDWSAEETIAQLGWLDDAAVELLEQPVPADDIDGLERVSAESPMPVAADESCVTARDVPRVANAVDIVVVKLAKCGGLWAGRRQIETAHAHDLSVMLGCMVESAAGIAGACQLAPLVEYADLDGALLLATDPVGGISMPAGSLNLAAVQEGIGAHE